jgi:hypothetical protein
MVATFVGIPSQLYMTRGANYTANSQGVITVTNPTGLDMYDLMAAGCIPVGPALLPPGIQTIFGGSSSSQSMSSFYEEGNLFRAIGNPLSQNAADTTDDILYGIILPANALDISGRGLQITAQGKTGATANNKRFKLFLNPTLSGATINYTTGTITGGTVSAGTAYADSGTWTANNNNVGWQISTSFFKYGAAGSNTQYIQSITVSGATHNGIIVPSFLTLPENAQITLVVTGSSYTTGAAGDIVLNFFEVNAMN